jgi:dipeptidyl aminopeptidase/acylaminoacyl peptidase
MVEERRGLTLEDFWRLRQVSDVQLSPDGREVAYVVGSYDEAHNTTTSAIWLVDLETRQARQFTTGEVGDTAPRWSPDGSRLAFVSTRHEGKPQVYVMPRDGGEPRRVTAEENGASGPTWAPDGRRLCYTVAMPSDHQQVPGETAWFAAHPDARQDTPRLRRQATLLSRFDGRGYIDRRLHLFLINLEQSDLGPRQLTHGDYDHTGVAWSPDGAVIAFLSNRTAAAEFNFVSDVWTLDVETGALMRLTDETLGGFGSPPMWSPDGRALAFYAAPDPCSQGTYSDPHLWAVSRTGGDQRDLSAGLDRPIRSFQPDYFWPSALPPCWSPDGTSVYFCANDRGDGAVHVVDVASGAVRRVSYTAADVVGGCCTPDGQTLVVLASTPLVPYDLFILPAAGGDLAPLTRTHVALLNEVALVTPERLRFAAPDGLEIEGWLYRPTRATSGQSVPLILNVHGGPRSAWGNLFLFQAQTLAAAGYTSLYINPRGSTGYGQAFSRLADLGEKDFGDLMAGVEAVLARGEVDPRRVGSTGISYGGFMTLWALGHSDRFTAGVAINGVSNFVSMYGVSDIGALVAGDLDFGGPFWTNEEQWQRYRHRSPLTYVDRISAPLLLLQSENDYRCPIEQGEQMLTALRIRRQTVELIRVPGASHVVAVSGTPHQRYFQWRLSHEWFDRYLTGVEPAAATIV